MALNKINLPALFVILFYPLILVTMAVFYYKSYGIGTFEITALIVTYYIANISVGIGLHRLWSHKSYKTKPWFEVVLAIVSAGTLQGPILAWASDHMLHHAYTDKERDPHSALRYKSKVLGFLWSHIGWMIFDTNKKIDRLALAALGKNKVVLWQFKHYWEIALTMNFIFPPLLGYLLFGDIAHAFGAFIFMGLGRALQQQATFCVNSVVHTKLGSRDYYYGTATDIWWLCLFLLGENWHNFHHAFANDYRNGHKWYHFDVHKWIIFLMSKVGLATDLVSTSKERIKNSVEFVKNKNLEDLKNDLRSLESLVLKIHDLALSKLKKSEESAASAAFEARAKLSKIVDNTSLILGQLQVLNYTKLSKKLVQRLYKRYLSISDDFSKLSMVC